MATHITEDCINCGACEPECPNEAISEGDEIYVIDPTLCTECVGFYDHEACQAVCPVECCLPDENNEEDEATLIARALKLHPDDAAAHPDADAARRLPTNRIVGAPVTAVPMLRELVAATGADELMVTAVAFHREARIRSLELLAANW